MVQNDKNRDDIKATPSQSLDELHAWAIDAFDTVAEATAEERALALEDRRFAFIAGAQWEGEWLDQFENSIRVEVNKVAKGLRKIIDDYRDNRVTVNFRASDSKASEETADTLDGLFRADLYRCKGQQAFDNAFEEAAAGGIGAWRLVNEYEDEYDPENDHQRIAFKAITDADQSVFWDPSAKEYDKRDAKWCFVISSLVVSAFEELAPGHASSWPDTPLRTYYDWFGYDVVRVAELYKVEIKSEPLLTLFHPLLDEEERIWQKDIKEEQLALKEQQGWQVIRSRKIKRRRVRKVLMSGLEVIKDYGYIAGDQIPVVPVYGQRRFIDNMERSQGHVRIAKDPQRIYNAMNSKLTETAAVSPTERPIFAPEQVAGLEHHWARMDIDRARYALANPLTNLNGDVVQTGPIGKVEAPQIAPAVVGLISNTSSDIAELTNADDTASEVRSNISAEAMDIAATRTDARNSIYMDNMRQSMQRTGEIYQSMARDVYIEEGRVVDTLGPDMEEGQATLKESYVDERGVYLVRNDLEVGKYKVISDVTEATATRRDKTVKSLVSVAQLTSTADPELANVALSTAILNMDGEGMDALQDWVRGRLVQAGVIEPSEEEQEAMKQAEEEARANDPQAAALVGMAEEAHANARKADAQTAQVTADAIKKMAEAREIEAKTNEIEVKTERDERESIAKMAREFIRPIWPFGQNNRSI